MEVKQEQLLPRGLAGDRQCARSCRRDFHFFSCTAAPRVATAYQLQSSRTQIRRKFNLQQLARPADLCQKWLAQLFFQQGRIIFFISLIVLFLFTKKVSKEDSHVILKIIGKMVFTMFLMKIILPQPERCWAKLYIFLIRFLLQSS